MPMPVPHENSILKREEMLRDQKLLVQKDRVVRELRGKEHQIWDHVNNSVLTQAYSFLGAERTLDVLQKVIAAIQNSDAAKRVHKPAAWLKSQLVVEVNMIVSDLIGMDVVPKRCIANTLNFTSYVSIWEIRANELLLRIYEVAGRGNNGTLCVLQVMRKINDLAKEANVEHAVARQWLADRLECALAHVSRLMAEDPKSFSKNLENLDHRAFAMKVEERRDQAAVAGPSAPIHHPLYHNFGQSRSPSPPLSPPLAVLNPHASAFFPAPADYGRQQQDYSRHLPSVPLGARSRLTPTPPQPQPAGAPLMPAGSHGHGLQQSPQLPHATHQYAQAAGSPLSAPPFRLGSAAPALPPSSGSRLPSTYHPFPGTPSYPGFTAALRDALPTLGGPAGGPQPAEDDLDLSAISFEAQEKLRLRMSTEDAATRLNETSEAGSSSLWKSQLPMSPVSSLFNAAAPSAAETGAKELSKEPSQPAGQSQSKSELPPPKDTRDQQQAARAELLARDFLASASKRFSALVPRRLSPPGTADLRPAPRPAQAQPPADASALSELRGQFDQLKTEMKELRRTKAPLCVTCGAQSCDTALVPCGHSSFCSNCAQKFPICPLCHESVTHSLRIQLPYVSM